MKYDWAAFLHERIDIPTPHADLAGITRGGYELVYTDKPNDSEKTLAAANARRGGGVNVWYSLGFRVGADGTIGDIRYDGPADRAMLAPGTRIIGVNGQVFSPEALRGAIDESKGNTKPIRLIVQAENTLSTADINYHDGPPYPSLKRTDGAPALLDDITKPLAPK